MESKSRTYLHNSDAVSSDLIEITEYQDVTVYKRYKYAGMKKVVKNDNIAEFLRGDSGYAE
jgi:hypothetical protein